MMEDNTPEDVEMECDFIKSKTAQCSEESNSKQDVIGNPVTPPSNNSMFDLSGYSPKSNLYNSEQSFIRRVGCERNLFSKNAAGSRVTSTPLLKYKNKLNFSLPSMNSCPITSITRDFLTNPLNSSLDSAKSKTESAGRIPYEYVNPFTPDGKIATTKAKAQKKMNRLSLDHDGTLDLMGDKQKDNVTELDLDLDFPERPRLNQFNVSRFNQEFYTVKVIGRGAFGLVLQCVNKLNGCVYAVKRSMKPVLSGFEERSARNEIYAHGVLDHPNIVRNYSCWNEQGFVYIQNEFCSQGNLDTFIKHCENQALSEADLKRLLLQMALALRHIHGKGLAHLDVKPDNIFLVKAESSDDRYLNFSTSEEDEDDEKGKIVFKLGDLGHVTSVSPVPDDVEDGDCRYLPRELLSERYDHLDKADIFALGLTVFEAGGAGELPKNGEVWQRLRDGVLPHVPTPNSLQPEILAIIREMIQPDPEKRPTAAELVKKIRASELLPTPRCDLFSSLHRFRHSNTHLQQKTELSDQYVRALVQSHRRLTRAASTSRAASCAASASASAPNSRRLLRLVGKKTNRSSSTAF